MISYTIGIGSAEHTTLILCAPEVLVLLKGFIPMEIVMLYFHLILASGSSEWVPRAEWNNDQLILRPKPRPEEFIVFKECA